MKVRSAIKRICGFCQIIRRGKILYVRCQKNNKHKQRQGFHSFDNEFKLGDKDFCECPSSFESIFESDTIIENCCENNNKENDLESNKNKLI